jgi:hypothetical protein
MRSPAILSAFLFLLASSASAQIQHEWTGIFDASPTGSDHINQVAVAPSGNVYAVGMSGVHDVLLEKFDAAGNPAWTRLFDYAGAVDAGLALVLEPGTEAVYVLGRGDTTSANGLVLKYDSAGTLLWTRSFGNAQFVTARLAPNGNLVAAAALDAGGLALCEYDPQGNLLWTGYEPNADYPAAIAFDGNGEIVVCGSYYGAGGSEVFGLTRFSSSGAYLWTRLVTGGGAGSQFAFDLVLDGAGNAYAAGRLVDPALGVREALVKVDPGGNVLWTRTLQGTQPNAPVNYEELGPLAFTANGNIRAAGLCANAGAGTDLSIVEYTPGGQLVWQGSWNGPLSQIELCLGLRVESDGTSTFLAGTQNGPDSYTPAVVRWDAHGAFLGAAIDDLAAIGSTNIWSGAFGAAGVHVFAGRTPSVTPTNALVVQVREQSLSFCFGDGSSGACPCANSSAAGEGRGCSNSSGNSARLTSTGVASLASDGLVLTSTGELSTSTTVFVQARAAGAPVFLADGVLCLSGPLRRLAVHPASGGIASAPSGSDPTLSARSAALGDPLQAGDQRCYQVVYRDPDPSFCPAPGGSTYNLSSALSVLWVP